MNDFGVFIKHSKNLYSVDHYFYYKKNGENKFGYLSKRPYIQNTSF